MEKVPRYQDLSDRVYQIPRYQISIPYLGIDIWNDFQNDILIKRTINFIY